jgi:hypothetical protein
MVELAQSLPWIQTGMKLVGFNASHIGPDGIYVGGVWYRVQHALDQLCGHKNHALSSRRRRRGGHNEYLYPRYALG